MASHAQAAVVTVKPKKKRASKERIKSSTVAIYASIFILLVSVVSVGYRTPEEVVSSTDSSTISASTALMMTKPSANDVTAAAVAASVASAADLSVAGYVAEFASSVQIQSQYAVTEETSAISKPTIVELSAASRNIDTYKVEEGDTVASVAAKFGISAETLKWANDLTGDTLVVNTELDILPRDGVVYTAKRGDTIEKIAERYKANASLITTYNDLEISGITPGLKLVIPGGNLPETERPGYVAPAPVYTGFVSGYGSWSGTVHRQWYVATPAHLIGGYAPGNCTAYAYMKRAAMGRPVPRMLGNAFTWSTQAAAMGYTVNKTPAPGAVIQAGNHVGIVEKVLPSGDLEISDMNFGYRLNNVAYRTIPASTVGNYMYIH